MLDSEGFLMVFVYLVARELAASKMAAQLFTSVWGFTPMPFAQDSTAFTSFSTTFSPFCEHQHTIHKPDTQWGRRTMWSFCDGAIQHSCNMEAAGNLILAIKPPHWWRVLFAMSSSLFSTLTHPPPRLRVVDLVLWVKWVFDESIFFVINLTF